MAFISCTICGIVLDDNIIKYVNITYAGPEYVCPVCKNHFVEMTIDY